MSKQKSFTLIEHECSKSMRRNKGFTLIELLVVIAVIGMLSSIVLVALGPAREKARDTKRLSNIRQLVMSLELYYDHYEEYPTYVDSGPDAGWDHSDLGDGFIKGLEDNTRGDNPDNVVFIKVPVDPINQSDGCHCCGSGNDLVYTYNNPGGDRQKFKLCVAIEALDISGGGYTFECANGNYPVYCIVHD